MLREQNIDAKDLDEIMKRLRELDSDRVYRTPPSSSGCRRLSAKASSASSTRCAARPATRPTARWSNGSEEVPAEFRALVEEYYRSLSKSKPRQ